VVKLSGSIDRIDFNENSGEWIILDYKTGNSSISPDKAHRPKGEDWVDLQLPLYDYALSKMGICGDTQPLLGYIVIPANTEKLGVEIAKWSPADLESARRYMVEVVEGIQREEFWPPTEGILSHYDDFAGLCGSEHLANLELFTEEEGEE